MLSFFGIMIFFFQEKMLHDFYEGTSQIDLYFFLNVKAIGTEVHWLETLLI